MAESNDKKLLKIKSDISTARFILTSKTPLYGVLSSHLTIIPVTEQFASRIDAACVTPSGIVMYNPNFVEKLTFREICGLLAHEALHPALNYFERFANAQYPDLANEAHDYSINLFIDESEHMDLPTGGLLNYGYKGLSAEEIYQILVKKNAASQESPSGDGGGDDGASGSGSPTKSATKQEYTLKGDVDTKLADEIEKHHFSSIKGHPITNQELKKIREKAEMDWKDALQNAIAEEKAKNQGSIPAEIAAYAEGIMKPKLNLKGMLKRFFGKHGRPTMASFKRRNKRNTYEPDTFIKPKMISNKPRIYILLDTSGSMFSSDGIHLTQNALGLINQFIKNYKYDVEIIMSDTRVSNIMTMDEALDALKNKKLALFGGGGSCFLEAFNTIWERAKKGSQNQAPIICFTDGMITVPEKEPRIRTTTAWITPHNGKPPTTAWGNHMPLDAIKPPSQGRA